MIKFITRADGSMVASGSLAEMSQLARYVKAAAYATVERLDGGPESKGANNPEYKQWIRESRASDSADGLGVLETEAMQTKQDSARQRNLDALAKAREANKKLAPAAKE